MTHAEVEAVGPGINLVTPQKTSGKGEYTAPPGFYDDWSEEQKQEYNELRNYRKMPGSFEPFEVERELAQKCARAIVSPSPVSLTPSPPPSRAPLRESAQMVAEGAANMASPSQVSLTLSPLTTHRTSRTEKKVFENDPDS